MKKIVICGLIHERNLGDPIIVASVQKLLENAVFSSCKYRVATADLFARINPNTNWGVKKLSLVERLPLLSLGMLRRLSGRISRPLGRKIAFSRWKKDPNGRKRLMRYFQNELADASLVVLPGGGLIEYCSHQYQLPVSALIQTAEKMNVPVVFNSVGLVGSQVDEKDLRYQILRDALNSPSVKSVSVRDDIQMMNGHYLRDGHPAVRTSDPGVWIASLLGKKRKEDADTVGLGLIRGDAFTDYSIRFSEDELIRLWGGIVRELDNRGIKWVFFCNGYEKDYALGVKILASLGIADIKGRIVERPTEYPQLLDTIASFRAVICHRLHACILSYALDIPCVALSWNRKLGFFFDAIGCPERVLEAGEFDAERIVDAMLKAESEGYDQEIKRAYMEEARRSVEELVKLIN